MSQRELTSAASSCDGSSECAAELHVHGCFADKGKCDEPAEHPAAQDRRWLTWRRWFGLIAAAFVVAYALGLGAWCYDEASYGGQPWFQPFEFVGFGGLCAFIAWRWIGRG